LAGFDFDSKIMSWR